MLQSVDHVHACRTRQAIKAVLGVDQTWDLMKTTEQVLRAIDVNCVYDVDSQLPRAAEACWNALSSRTRQCRLVRCCRKHV